MALYPLIHDGRVVQIEAAPFQVHSALAWGPDISNTLPQPAVGWSATFGQGGWTFTAPAAPAQQPAEAAHQALAASDRVIIRCYEHGVAVPAEWQTYRAALRSCITSNTGPLPTQPAFPAGT